jgi:hypothetical protein
MCTISVSWDGWLYDFDFNQMLDLKVASKSTHISEFVESDLKIEILSFNNIVYGCCFGAGSSCQGVVA